MRDLADVVDLAGALDRVRLLGGQARAAAPGPGPVAATRREWPAV